MAEKQKPFDYCSDSPPILKVQYKGYHSETLAKKSARYQQCADKIHEEENENLYDFFKIILFRRTEIKSGVQT